MTETWFTPDLDDSLIQIPGFYSFRNDRQDNFLDKRRGGGTIIYASENIRPISVNLPANFVRPTGVEYSFIKFNEPALCYLLCAYVPPGLIVDSFDLLKKFVAEIFDYVLRLTPDAKLYVCGDFNRYDFTFLSTEFNLVNIVCVPTFRDATLDKFFCDADLTEFFSVVNAPPLGNAINLHNVVVISRAVSTKETFSIQKVYDLRKSHTDAFLVRLSRTNWFSHSCQDDVEDFADFLYDRFAFAMSAIPVSFIRITRKTKPWITPIVIDLINKRWSAFRSNNFVLYNHYKKKVKKEIFKSKVLWSNRMKTSGKGIYSIMSNVRGKNESNSVSKIISLFDGTHHAVESLNKFFETFFCTCKDRFIPPMRSSDYEYIPEVCDPHFVRNLLNTLRTDKAMGSDQIPPILLKISAGVLCDPLSHIFNLSFRTAKVPGVWKIADVCPVPKSTPITKDNFRPISLLPVMSKIFEKIILKMFYENLLKGFDDCQFAYRRGSSTVCALLTMNEGVLRFLDNPDVVGVRILSFDMSHAFDCVPHDILLKRMEDLNFVGGDFLVRWLEDYLKGRKQRVRLGTAVSSLADVTSGVPQGSILGPYFFSIFMATFSAVSSESVTIKYADDVTIVTPVYKNSLDDLTVVNDEICNFVQWCSENRMSMNRSKSKVLTINTSHSPLPSVSLLDNVNVLKILGVFLNSKLTWSDHFDHIISKLSKRLYVLRVLKCMLTHDELVEIFNMIFRSVIEYACQVFVNPGRTLDARLLRLCKRAFKLIHGQEVSVCNGCDMMNIGYRRQILAMRLFNCARKDPKHILHKLIPDVSQHSDRLILPHVRTSRRLNGFFLYCSMLYNSK